MLFDRAARVTTQPDRRLTSLSTRKRRSPEVRRALTWSAGGVLGRDKPGVTANLADDRILKCRARMSRAGVRVSRRPRSSSIRYVGSGSGLCSPRERRHCTSARKHQAAIPVTAHLLRSRSITRCALHITSLDGLRPFVAKLRAAVLAQINVERPPVLHRGDQRCGASPAHRAQWSCRII
jgi:hypothetical protein